MSWDEHITDGISAVRSSNYAAAEKSFKQALQFAKQNFSRTDSRLALTLSLLGHTYFRNEDFQRAELLLDQSARLHADGLLNEPCLFMDTFALSTIKRRNGKRSEAYQIIERSLQRLQTCTLSEAESNTVEYFQMEVDELYAQLSSSEREALKQALPQEETVDTPPEGKTAALTAQEIEAAQGTSSGGMAPPAEGFTSGAISATQMWEQQLRAGMDALHTEEDETESWVSGYLKLETALRVASKVFEPNDERVIATMKALADASAKLKMFEQAETLYREAISRSRQLGDNEPLVTSLRLHLALFYMDFDQLNQAKKILDTVKTPENLGSIPYGEALPSSIEKACRQIAIYDSVQTIVRQAQSAEEQADFDKAAKLTNTALTTLRQSFAPNHPETARILRYRSQLLQQMGQADQAAELAQRAERIERAQESKASEWLRITEPLPKPDIGVPV